MSNLKCEEMNLICNDIAWKEKTQRTESILGWRQWGPTIFHTHQSMWPYVCTVTFFLVSMVNHLALQVLPYRDAFQPRSGSLNSAGYVLRFMIYIWDSRWMSAKCEIWPCVTVDIYWHLLTIPLYSTVIMFQHCLLASEARFFASSAKKNPRSELVQLLQLQLAGALIHNISRLMTGGPTETEGLNYFKIKQHSTAIICFLAYMFGYVW